MAPSVGQISAFNILISSRVSIFYLLSIQCVAAAHHAALFLVNEKDVSLTFCGIVYLALESSIVSHAGRKLLKQSAGVSYNGTRQIWSITFVALLAEIQH